jgi:hypothetical protein
MPKTITHLKQVVDRLGQVKARLADLHAEEEALKGRLTEAHIDSLEGRLFRATVSRYEQTCVDYAGLVEQLAPPARLVRRFTSTSERTTVRVVSRNGKERKQ